MFHGFGLGVFVFLMMSFQAGSWRACSTRQAGMLQILTNALLVLYFRANLEGMDDQCDPNPFDTETAKVLLKVLTARSVKRLLIQLQELDMITAQWLNNYAAENSPMTGNEFIEKLFDVKGTVIIDKPTATKRTIDPQNLAHRILIIRNDMAKKATLSLPEYVDREDGNVMRKHLVKNTFVSGAHDGNTEASGSTKRRGYFRSPKKN